jgi:hypothetical protein
MLVENYNGDHFRDLANDSHLYPDPGNLEDPVARRYALKQTQKPLPSSEIAQPVQAKKINMALSRQIYHLIHKWGKENFLEAQPVVESFLASEDAQLRSIALEVLTNHWRLADYWEMAKRFLERDPDEDCRMRGASALSVLKMNTNDRSTLALLAQVVRNEQEQKIVRETAYAAMKGVICYDPREQLKIASRGIDLSKDVDWNMVNSYLQVK